MDRLEQIRVLESCLREIEINKLRFVPAMIRQVRDAIADEQETADNAGGWQPERTATERQY